MSIGNQRINPAATSPNRQPVVRTQARSVGNLANYGTTTPVRQLSVGQIIKGEISDLRNTEVSVTLEDNTSVTGHLLENGSNLAIGDAAAFRVTEINANGIYLEAIPQSELIRENQIINKALEEAGLPKSEKNQEIVRQLMHNQMPISKNSIQQILQQTYISKDVSISTIILLNKHHIPVTPENAIAFESYKNGTHSLLENVQQITESVNQFLTALSGTTDSAMPQTINQLLALLTSDSAPPALEATVSQLPYEMREELLEILDTFELTPEQKAALSEGRMSIRDAIHLVQSTMNIAAEIDAANLEDAKLLEMQKNNTPGQELAPEVIDQLAQDIPKTLDLFDSPAITSLFHEFENIQQNNNEIASVLSKDQLQQLQMLLKDIPVSESFRAKISGGEVTVNDFLSVLKNVLSFTDPGKIRHLIQSEAFHTLIDNQCASHFSLQLDDLAKENGVSDFYHNFYQELEQLQQIASNSTMHSEQLAGQANHAKQNVDFMQTLNQMFSYVQLPVFMKGKNIHSDLYVFTRKKEMQNHPDKLKVLLHLDMESLGSMDIHITMNQNQIISQFYLAEETSIPFIENNMHLLQERLEEKGYSLYSEVQMLEKPVDLVKDFMERDLPSSNLKRYTFDIRA